MDDQVLQLLARLDQTRSELRDMLMSMPTCERASLLKTCLVGELDGLGSSHHRLVGLLAAIAMLDLSEQSSADAGL